MYFLTRRPIYAHMFNVLSMQSSELSSYMRERIGNQFTFTPQKSKRFVIFNSVTRYVSVFYYVRNLLLEAFHTVHPLRISNYFNRL
jgi:hypothetical protein